MRRGQIDDVAGAAQRGVEMAAGGMAGVALVGGVDDMGEPAVAGIERRDVAGKHRQARPAAQVAAPGRQEAGGVPAEDRQLKVQPVFGVRPQQPLDQPHAEKTGAAGDQDRGARQRAAQRCDTAGDVVQILP